MYCLGLNYKIKRECQRRYCQRSREKNKLLSARSAFHLRVTARLQIRPVAITATRCRSLIESFARIELLQPIKHCSIRYTTGGGSAQIQIRILLRSKQCVVEARSGPYRGGWRGMPCRGTQQNYGKTQQVAALERRFHGDV